jgi:hypothetical protein
MRPLSIAATAPWLFGGLAVVVCSAEADDARFQVLELRLSVAESEIVQNEPLVVVIELANRSPGPQIVLPDLETDLGLVTYRIVGPDGKLHPFQPVGQASHQSEPQVLAEDESLLHRQVLLYSADWGVHFKQPGEYRIQAVYRATLSKLAAPDSRERRFFLESNVVTVDVKPARGDDEKALEHFRGNPQALFALGLTHEWMIGREFETILRKYPNCSYAPWCYYFLARAWPDHPLRNAQLKSERAVRMFETLLTKYPDFPLATDVRYQIARELSRLGRKKEALERVERLIEEHPNLRLFQRVKLQIRVYRERGLEIPLESFPG